MPPGRQFQAAWAALHMAAAGVAVYVVVSDVLRARRLAAKVAATALLSAAAALHIASAVYHGQKAV
jgi:hypothetical protein